MAPVKGTIMKRLLVVMAVLGVQVWPAVMGSIVDDKIHPAASHKRSFKGGSIFNLTFTSRIDGISQPMLVQIPKGYTPEKSWPLLVTLHGLGDGPLLAPRMHSIVQIGPYGRQPAWSTEASKQDVFQAIELAKQLLNIDAERIYLCGFSKGAITTFELALRYPDNWAACVPICGRCDQLFLIENAEHLPFWIHAGEKDTVLPPAYSRTAYHKALELGFTHWKYTESKGMGHSFQANWKEVQKWLLSKKRVKDPKAVSFCTRDPNSTGAYWVEIIERDKHAGMARINAAISGRQITVTTKNVANYKLKLNRSLINYDKPVTVVENGTTIFSQVMDPNNPFVRKSAKLSHSCNGK